MREVHLYEQSYRRLQLRLKKEKCFPGKPEHRGKAGVERPGFKCWCLHSLAACLPLGKLFSCSESQSPLPTNRNNNTSFTGLLDERVVMYVKLLARCLAQCESSTICGSLKLKNKSHVSAGIWRMPRCKRLGTIYLWGCLKDKEMAYMGHGLYKSLKLIF